MITNVHNLDKTALVDILTKPKNALVRQYHKFFEFDGVELEFTDDSLGAIADQAILRATGARGLRAIMEEVLLNTMYELPSRQDVTKCVIDEDVVRSKVNPTLVPVKETPSASARNAPREAAPGCDRPSVRPGRVRVLGVRGRRIEFDGHAGPRGARGRVLDLDADADRRWPDRDRRDGVSAQFDGATISGTAGCNSYHASYEASGGDISFGPIAGTKKICPEDEQSTEDRYLQLLAEIGTYEVSGRSMSMNDTDGTPVLQFMQG